MKVSLQLRGIDVDGAEFEELTSTDNVSAGGFLCQCRASLFKNSTVDVFLTSGTERNHVGVARVARRQDPETPWQKYGFHFVSRTNNWVLQPVS